MRIKRLLREVLGLSRGVVVCGWELDWDRDERPVLRVEVRDRVRRRGRCGRCGERVAWYDRGGGQRSWRHLDVAFARCDLVADAHRVDCPRCGPTVAALPGTPRQRVHGCLRRCHRVGGARRVQTGGCGPLRRHVASGRQCVCVLRVRPWAVSTCSMGLSRSVSTRSSTRRARST
ncbi:MAG: hypothetical protein DYH08_13955 [Actinobacteria bacterium ATB1]|nr:hypothetical protein [Actinobacteria bacterium ATB1]